jgi:hypothetical protein
LLEEERKEKKKVREEKWLGAFFPGLEARHTLLSCQAGF